jgi:hypothetical protein
VWIQLWIKAEVEDRCFSLEEVPEDRRPEVFAAHVNRQVASFRIAADTLRF